VLGERYMSEERYTKTIMVRIDPELLEHLKHEVERLNTDMSTYIRWCIRSGLYLEDLNKYFSTDGDEREE
jgi:predicted DNA-binding protein